VRALEMVGQQWDQRLKLKLFLSGHRGTWTRHCRGLGASSCQRLDLLSTDGIDTEIYTS
jgi:hypothetical protein